MDFVPKTMHSSINEQETTFNSKMIKHLETLWISTHEMKIDLLTFLEHFLGHLNKPLLKNIQLLQMLLKEESVTYPDISW